MQLAERTNLGTLGAGVVGWGSAFPGLARSGAGDVGDVGDLRHHWRRPRTAGLHPDMRKRVERHDAGQPEACVSPRASATWVRSSASSARVWAGCPVGPRAHTRGMAADLGPRSQYGWIVNNARKFGLKRGISAGEPWHVGMGDIGEPSASRHPGDAGQRRGRFRTCSMGRRTRQHVRQPVQGHHGRPSAGAVGGGRRSRASAGASPALMQGDRWASSAGTRWTTSGCSTATSTADGGGGDQRGAPGLPTGPGRRRQLVEQALIDRIDERRQAVAVAVVRRAFASTSAGDTGRRQDARCLLPCRAGGHGHCRSRRTTSSSSRRSLAIEGNNSGTFNPFNSTGGSSFPNSSTRSACENYPDWSHGCRVERQPAAEVLEPGAAAGGDAGQPDERRLLQRLAVRRCAPSTGPGGWHHGANLRMGSLGTVAPRC